MGYFPDTESNDIDSITFETAVRDDFRVFTRKQSVEKAIGDYCFLILGTDKKIKKYFLWSFFMIDDVKETPIFSMPMEQDSILSDPFF